MKSLLKYTTSTICHRENGSTFFIHKFDFCSGKKTKLGFDEKPKRLNYASEHNLDEDQQDMFENGLEISWEELTEAYEIVEKKNVFIPDEDGEDTKEDEDTGEIIKGRIVSVVRWMYDK